jgi:hypothetical protein
MSEMKKPCDDWRLQKLELEMQRWGDDKGAYTGSITFENGDNEMFRFKIRPDLAEPYIDLIAADIVRGADLLAERLIESLKLRDR